MGLITGSVNFMDVGRFLDIYVNRGDAPYDSIRIFYDANFRRYTYRQSYRDGYQTDDWFDDDDSPIPEELACRSVLTAVAWIEGVEFQYDEQGNLHCTHQHCLDIICD